MKENLPLFLTIDLGTSGPKVAIIDLYGEVLAFHMESIPLISEGIFGYEQDPRLWWEKTILGIQKVLGQNPDLKKRILTICTTAQWSGTVALDKEKEPLMNAVIWMDSRGASKIKKLMDGIVKVSGYDLKKLLYWIYKTGGAPGLSGKDSLAHILWLRDERPEIYEKTSYFLEPKDYLNFCLSGEIATSYDTMSLHWVSDHRDIKNIVYDKKLLSQTGIEESKLPKMGPATKVIGTILPHLANLFGLNSNTKVVCGSPDIPSAAIGSGAVLDYQCHLYIGTSSWITCHVPFKKTDLKTSMASLPSAIPGKYFVANEQESAGVCIQYFLENFFKSSKDDTDFYKYEKIHNLALESNSGSNGVIFTPWLNGERTPVEDKYTRGGFFNVSMNNGLQDFSRSVFEGVAYNSKWLLTSVERFIKKDVPCIHFIGGGASSDFWSQVHADILEKPVKQLSDPKQANARGAAWIGAVGMGLIDFSDIPLFVKIAKTYQPDSKKKILHQKQFDEFLNIYKSNKKIYYRLNALRN